VPTTPGGLPFPSSSDAANVPADLQALALGVEGAYLKSATAASTYAPLANAALTTPTITSAVLTSPEETVTISATAATGTIAYDAITQAVLYYTTNASANWTLNIRGNSGTTLNSVLSTGQSITVVFLVTNGATAFYQTGFQVDGSAATVRWQGGSAPAAGNASSIDAYTFTIIKTGNAAFTPLGSLTRFA
jgi:hypothetical protein